MNVEQYVSHNAFVNNHARFSHAIDNCKHTHTLSTAESSIGLINNRP
jgi:hypothetical protein